MKLEVLPDPQWAVEVGRRLAERVTDRPDSILCLPTGNTPIPAYTALASSSADLSRCTVFLLDEFLLPQGSPGRCDSMLRRSLLDLIAPQPKLVAWDTSGDVDAEALRMEEAIADCGGIDLALLGLGANGHIGINEPGSTASSRARVVRLDEATSLGALRYGAEVAPTHGVTLGVATLLEAREIWLLVTGAHKAEILARTMRGSISSELPATYLRAHPNLTVLADASAAAQ